MWIPISAAMLLLGGAHPAFPASQEPTEAQVAGAAKLHAAYIALEDEYDEAYETWRQALRAASESSRKARETNPGALFEGPERVEPAFFPRFDRLAQAGSAPAQLWCLSSYISDAKEEERRRDFSLRVMTVLSSPDVDHTTLSQLISRNQGRHGAMLTSELASTLHALVETVSPAPEAQAQAAFYLARSAAEGIQDEDQAYKTRLEAHRSVATRYPNTKGGIRAGGYVFGEEKLQIGMVAPDILGKDVDGNPMKLTDFGGKVTVVDFWGFW